MQQPKSGYVGNIEEETLQNTNFRKVLHTGTHSQLVVMSLKPGEDIGMEVHPTVDQFIRIEQGHAKAILDGEEFDLPEEFVVIIAAGTKHNIVNIGDTELKLYTIYSPPNHPEGTVHATREEAMKAEEEEHNH
jgi:mannose-6-phosphate isomerase-like protein (cupin superfamily)